MEKRERGEAGQPGGDGGNGTSMYNSIYYRVVFKNSRDRFFAKSCLYTIFYTYYVLSLDYIYDLYVRVISSCSILSVLEKRIQKFLWHVRSY